MSLAQINSVYTNACTFSIDEQVLPGHDVLDSLITLPRHWRELAESEDDDARHLFFSIWQLCRDVSSCLVPFDSPDLGLVSRQQTVAAEARRWPDKRRQLAELQKRVEWLVEHPVNPKGEFVFRLIEEEIKAGQSIGLVARMSRFLTPGWQEDFAERFDAMVHGCRLLRTRRDLLDSVLDVIILPGSGQWCPFRTDLYTLYRSSRLTVVRYSGERAPAPRLPELPQGTVTRRSGYRFEESARPKPLDTLDDWISDEEWELARLRSQRGGDDREISDFQFLVRARLVLLETGEAVYLQDDRKVIELSPLFSNDAEDHGSGARLPRKHPRELRSGDLIGLRTSGSGDYLEVIADQLLVKAGKGELRRHCTDWKTGLLTVLKQYGPESIAERLAAHGTELSSPNYIWHWATEDVIRPQKKEAFANLIEAIADLHALPNVGAIPKYVDRRWREMKELISYHHKAGLEIRRALLRRFFELLERSSELNEDRIVLRLPDVDAGEITLFRVAAVEPRASEIPYTRINTVF